MTTHPHRKIRGVFCDDMVPTVMGGSAECIDIDIKLDWQMDEAVLKSQSLLKSEQPINKTN